MDRVFIIKKVETGGGRRSLRAISGLDLISIVRD